MIGRTGRRAALALAVLSGALLPAGDSAAQGPDLVGVWNLRTRNIAMRATGGVRNVLLRVEEVGGELRGEMTSPRNTFLPVSDLRYADGRVVILFGSYEYAVTVDGDRMSGTMTSPVDTLEVTGWRQTGLMYGGDEPERYVATRSGVLGHRVHLLPPEGEPDPAAWVRERVESVADIALVLRGIPVSFENPEEFEAQLMAYAGRRVDVVGEWVGERYRIHGIELTPGEGP